MNSGVGIKYLLPEMSLIASGIIALLIDMILKGKRKTPVAFWNLFAVALTAGFVITRWNISGYCMNGLARLNPVTNLFDMIFLVTAFFTVLLSISYLERVGYNYGEFYGLLLFSVAGMFIMASAADLMVFFLGLELMSIALYIMVGLFRTRKESNEAAIKYLIMGAFTTAFLLYGIALVFGATGTTKLAGIAQALASGRAMNQSIIFLLAMILILVGFAFKLALAPFHMWTPDVYQGAPTPLTGFMSVSVKGAAYAALIAVLAVMRPAVKEWTILLQFLAVITMTWGNIAALRQDNIKRMLAYSSIAHSGYILVGIVSYGNAASSNLSLSAVIFYLVVYLFMNIGAFAATMIVAGEKDDCYHINNYKGLSRRKPILALLVSIFMFSLMGMPPLAGFMGKFQVFYAAIKAGMVPLAVIAVINSVVSVYYYLRVVLVMYMDKGDQPVNETKATLVEFTIISLFALCIIALGLFPSVIMNVITKGVAGG